MQVTIGTAERGLEFAELTGYPADSLLADPENVTYEALQLKKGVVDTFFNIEVGHPINLSNHMANIVEVGEASPRLKSRLLLWQFDSGCSPENNVPSAAHWLLTHKVRFTRVRCKRSKAHRLL